MEQTVNTFKGGLQSDTNPMVQGNDTLSDALNATFVTMNGNEIVLQNDMGNRRVDNAYLPAGYEPVGIKEYGGIIYIAAYNPITNRSLIGSFPSPERRISKNDGLTSSIDFINGFEFNTDNSLGINCLKEDTLLFPLTKDTSLHAGDKFIVYGGLDEQSKISNFDNVDGSKVKSPKNKQYTLALGILNSENLFVDITSSLVRWNGDSIMDLDDKTDLYKFNAGYFIKQSEPSTDSDLSFTLNDVLLTEERENAYLIMKANTYSYKLVGPLYLQVRYNHILDFSYNIYGTYDKTENKVELFVEGFITYNCPDAVTSVSAGDSNYKTYEEGNISNNNFGYDVIINGDNNFSIYGSPETKYNPETNLYSTKIVKTKIINGVSEDTKIEYIIGVKADLKSNHYLYGLSSKGSIDVNKLGSGTVELTGWRFTNNYSNKTGTITYTMDAYPKYNEEFRNFKIKFENVNDLGNKVELEAPINNGKTNLNVTWTEEKIDNLLQDRSLYKVKFTYDIYDKTTGARKNNTSLEKEEFYLTTELFNSCYSPNSAEFISDYGYPDGNTSISECRADYNEDNTSLKTIARKLTITPVITTSSKLQETDIEESTKGSLISMSDVDYDITTTYTKDINITFTTNLEANENLYPNYIKFKNELTPEDFTFTELKSNISELNNDINASETPEVTKENIRNNRISTTVNWEDKVTITSRKKYEGELKDVFDSFYNYLDKHTPSEYISYSGIILESEGVSGAQDHHGVYVVLNLTNWLGSMFPLDGSNGEIQIATYKADLSESGKWNIAAEKFKASKYVLQDYYLNILPNKIFACLGLEQTDENGSFICKNGPNPGEDGPLGFGQGLYKELDKYTRLMWKSNEGWAYIDLSEPIKTDSIDNNSVNIAVLNYLKSLTFFKKLYYRRYKTLDSSMSGKEFYIPKGALEYEPYSKDYILKYKLSLNQDKGIELNNQNPLNFTVIDSQEDTEKEINIFTLLSGENFLDLINSEPSVSKFILEDTTSVDTDGNPLSINNVYVKTDNGYKKAEDLPIRVYLQDENETYLVCVSNKGQLTWKCDFKRDDDEDSDTWFSYDLVDKINLDDLNTKVNTY